MGIQKVNVTGVSAHTMFFGMPPQVLILGDIYKEDFSNEMKGASGMTAVFSILMDTIIKSIAQNAKNMLGKAAKKKGFFGRICGGFELGEVALQSNSALFTVLLVSVGGPRERSCSHGSAPVAWIGGERVSEGVCGR